MSNQPVWDGTGVPPTGAPGKPGPAPEPLPTQEPPAPEPEASGYSPEPGTEAEAPPEAQEAAPEPAEDEGYDPSEHNVAEVQAYLEEHPDQTDYVLDRERSGKARTTLIGA